MSAGVSFLWGLPYPRASGLEPATSYPTRRRNCYGPRDDRRLHRKGSQSVSAGPDGVDCRTLTKSSPHVKGAPLTDITSQGSWSASKLPEKTDPGDPGPPRPLVVGIIGGTGAGKTTGSQRSTSGISPPEKPGSPAAGAFRRGSRSMAASASWSSGTAPRDSPWPTDSGSRESISSSRDSIRSRHCWS